jgi:hypothetical protein
MGLRGRICTPRGASPLRGFTSIVAAVTENRNVAQQRAVVQSGGRQLTLAGFAAALQKSPEELVASGFSGEGFANYDAL